MNLLLITFSLRNSERDYSLFFVALRGNALNWWHFIEQTVVVSTEQDAEEYTRLLLPYMEKTDSLLVVKVSPHQFEGWLPQEAWDWFRNVSNQIQQQESPAPRTLPPIPPQPALKR
jgi:hypothetical protein